MIHAFAAVMLAVYAVISLVSDLPQLIKLLRTKSADDVSFTSFLLYAIGNGSYIVYAAIEDGDDFWLVAAPLIEELTLIITCALIFYYQRRSRRSKGGRDR